MRFLHALMKILASQEISRCFRSSVDIEANLDLQEDSPSDDWNEDLATDITIRIKAVIDPPKTSFKSSLLTYGLLNVTSTGTGSTAEPPGFVWPSEWKAYATPKTVADTPARTSMPGWNTTFSNPIATLPSPNTSQSFQFPNMDSFTRAASATRRSPARRLHFRLLTATMVLFGFQGVK